MASKRFYNIVYFFFFYHKNKNKKQEKDNDKAAFESIASNQCPRIKEVDTMKKRS